MLCGTQIIMKKRFKCLILNSPQDSAFKFKIGLVNGLIISHCTLN